MRGALSSLALLLAALSLAACDGPSETEGPSAARSQTSAATTEPAVVMPLDAPPQEEEPLPESALGSGDKAECEAEIGADAAARLVRRCMAVSPATHPPCHIANPCALIQDEIDRSCAQYAVGETRPTECTQADIPAR